MLQVYNNKYYFINFFITRFSEVGELDELSSWEMNLWDNCYL